MKLIMISHHVWPYLVTEQAHRPNHRLNLNQINAESLQEVCSVNNNLVLNNMKIKKLTKNKT